MDQVSLYIGLKVLFISRTRSVMRLSQFVRLGLGLGLGFGKYFYRSIQVQYTMK